MLQAAMWDDERHRTSPTIARPAAEDRGDRRLLDPRRQDVPHRAGRPTSARSIRSRSEKLSPVLSIFKYDGWENALKMVTEIYKVGGRGHSVRHLLLQRRHIDQLARMAPVSRIMVRQPQSKANSGSFTNGMPMTSSMGCGIWGGNITNENVVAEALHADHLGQPPDPGRSSVG